VLFSAVVYAGLILAGLAPTRYAVSGTAAVPLLWLLVTSSFVGIAIVRIRSLRFGVERREGHRFPVSFPAMVDGLPGRMVDVSLGGAQVSVPGPGLPLGTQTLLAMWVPDRSEPIIFGVTVCSRQEDHHRLEFRVRDWRALAALSATAMAVGALAWAADADADADADAADADAAEAVGVGEPEREPA
jgi:cellulose synthase (UDP-forming)